MCALGAGRWGTMDLLSLPGAGISLGFPLPILTLLSKLQGGQHDIAAFLFQGSVTDRVGEEKKCSIRSLAGYTAYIGQHNEFHPARRLPSICLSYRFSQNVCFVRSNNRHIAVPVEVSDLQAAIFCSNHISSANMLIRDAAAVTAVANLISAMVADTYKTRKEESGSEAAIKFLIEGNCNAKFSHDSGVMLGEVVNPDGNLTSDAANTILIVHKLIAANMLTMNTQELQRNFDDYMFESDPNGTFDSRLYPQEAANEKDLEPDREPDVDTIQLQAHFDEINEEEPLDTLCDEEDNVDLDIRNGRPKETGTVDEKSHINCVIVMVNHGHPLAPPA